MLEIKRYKTEVKNKEFPILRILEITESYNEKEELVGTSNHRWCLNPNDSLPLDIEDDEVKNVYDSLFTDDVKLEYDKFLDSQKPSASELEQARISSIKAKAGEIIQRRYSIVWQLNHPRVDERYSQEYAWIDRIREISNQAEVNGKDVKDIVWE